MSADRSRRVLECSRIGDPRFSAFRARIRFFGENVTIEEAYQLSKRFGDKRPESVKDCKGKYAKFKGMSPTHIVVRGIQLSPEYLTPWYYFLWWMYLKKNPTLVEYASHFDDFTDRFKGKSVNSQADVVRMYVKQGEQSVVDVFIPLIKVVFPEYLKDGVS